MSEHEKAQESDTETQTKNEDRFWSRARSFLEHYRCESKKILTVGKLKWDTTSFQRHRTNLFRALGESVYLLIKEDRFALEEIHPLVDQLNELEKRILDQEHNIQTITGHTKRQADQTSGSLKTKPSKRKKASLEVSNSQEN